MGREEIMVWGWSFSWDCCFCMCMYMYVDDYVVRLMFGCLFIIMAGVGHVGGLFGSCEWMELFVG